MQYLRIMINSLFLLLVSIPANAYLVTDTLSFNRIITTSEENVWTYDLADYGLVKGRDIISNGTLTFEFRDPNTDPDRDFMERPFIQAYLEWARNNTTVYQEDFVIDNGSVSFNAQGTLRVWLTVANADVWLGNVILRFDVEPGTPVPEPGALMLLGFGLLVFGLRWTQWR